MADKATECEFRLRVMAKDPSLISTDQEACKLGADAIVILGEICAQSAGWNDTVTALLRASREDV